MTKRLLRVIALILIAIVMIPLVPAVNSSAQTLVESAPSSPGETVRVSEIEFLRETNSETYLMSDGSFSCIVYSDDKYFYDEESNLQLIDNTIITAKTYSGVEPAYCNVANDFDIMFSGKSSPMVSIQSKNTTLAFSPVTSMSGVHSNSTDDNSVVEVGEVENCSILSALTETGDNTITYSNVFNNTDLVYVLENDVVKEYIILKDEESPESFSFVFSLDGLTHEVAGGVNCFFDEFGNIIFQLPSLFAVDSGNAFTENVMYRFEPIDGSDDLLVTISLDSEWKASDDRKYPIVIDPTTMISSAQTADSFVSSLYPSTNYYLDTYLRTGYDTAYGVRHSFLRFEIPSTIHANSVTSAYLDLEKASGSTPTVRAYNCDSSWSSSTITWNNAPGYYSNTKSSVSFLRTNGENWYRMDVTEIVSRWVDGIYANSGFVIMDETENDSSHWTSFYSSDAASPHKPELHINFSAPTVNVNLCYDQAYNTRNSSTASSRITNEAVELQEYYMGNFGIYINYTITAFSSYADTFCTTSPTQPCSHLSEGAECASSVLYENSTTSLKALHHTNIRNIAYRIPFPDTSSTLRVAYIGHITCDNDPVFGHIMSPLNGLAEINIGLAIVISPDEENIQGTSLTLAQVEAHTLLHEFGHFFGIVDHYGGQYGTSSDMSAGSEYTYSPNCSYGENRKNENLIANYTICEGCRAAINENRNNYDHGG